jgi:hypothetical protein
MTDSLVLWRRLDLPGHDAARFRRDGAGWRLEGIAAFASEEGPCALTYEVRLTARWRTRSARISGWAGGRELDLRLQAGTGGHWSVDGVVQPHLDGCEDVDLSFTPATNTLPIRRLDLAVGGEGTSRAAWLRLPEFTFEPLVQRYERLATSTWKYGTADGVFVRKLTVRPDGVVADYPGLWRAEVSPLPLPAG